MDLLDNIELLDKIFFEVKREVVIEPFLTKKCNWKCGHCMYDCSPKSSNDFISDQILDKLKKQVDFLQKLNIPVTINLLGGEPTLQFDKLKHVVDVVSSWNVAITMPTNGWWLVDNSSTKKFMNVFEDLISKDGSGRSSNNGNGLWVRISDEQYHSVWRKGNNNKEYFKELFNQKSYKKIKPNIYNPWISWQELSPNYLINPHGRGLDVSNIRSEILDKCNTEKFCIQHYEKKHLQSIHYELNGDISSVCMFGGEHGGIGTIDDNILYIFLLLNKYEEYRFKVGGYNCYNCKDMFLNWKKDNLENLKEQLFFYNSFETERFLPIW
jgi:organic radical activating enzyme